METSKSNQDQKELSHCDTPVQENCYHRAVGAGAKYFCSKCNSHLDKNLKEVNLD